MIQVLDYELHSSPLQLGYFLHSPPLAILFWLLFAAPGCLQLNH